MAAKRRTCSHSGWRCGKRNFGATAFGVEPYRLGRDNDEAPGSSAWSFYRHCGSAQQDPATQRMAPAEERKLLERADARSGRATLRRLDLSSLASFGAAKREVWRRLAPVLVQLALECRSLAWVSGRHGT